MARAGITDPKLAEAAGTTKQQIHKLRHGERKLTVQWAKRLAPKLDCTWQELIEGPSEPDDPQRVALFVAYNSLDQRDRDTLLRVAESLRRDDPPATPVPPRERAPPPRPTRGGSVAEERGVRGRQDVASGRCRHQPAAGVKAYQGVNDGGPT